MEVPLERIHVIPNGVDPLQFLGIGPEAGGLAKQFSLLEGDPLLLLPARVTPRKNIELALQVVADLRGTWPRAMLLVTGPIGAHSSDNRQYLEFLVRLSQSLGIEDRTVFLALLANAALSDDAMRQIYRLADVLLLPSRDEGFGIPILEAGLARIPVVCSAIPSLMELGGENAIYFDLDTKAVEVADRISAVLGADKVYRLRKHVLHEHTWDHIYEGLLAPILELELP